MSQPLLQVKDLTKHFPAKSGMMGKTGSVVKAVNGVSFDIDEVHRWTIRDGRAVAAHFSIDTAAMLAALAQ